MFHVRAWYDTDNYRIKTSNGVKIDVTPPPISQTHAVIETLSLGSNDDIDYTSDPTHLYVRWPNVFHESESDIKSYTVCLGTDKGLCDVYAYTVEPHLVEITIDNIDLTAFVIYYTSVKACNMANLCSAAYSDGFKV